MHTNQLYNTLLTLSRNLFFYNKIRLNDTFESRIYLMFIHFSIMMIVFKKKGKKFDQKSYDSLFFNIENNLRELGYGDVAVNKKMKDLNKILYDILLKIEIKESDDIDFKINDKILQKYFDFSNEKNDNKKDLFSDYFVSFFNYCFAKSSNNMVEDSIKFIF